MACPRLPFTAVILASLALAAPNLRAADIKFGLQAGLGSPGSDLKPLLDSSVGSGLGGFMLINFRNGHALRPRIDAWSYKGSDLVAPGLLSISREANLISVGADYLFYPNGTPEQGLYVLAGAGFANNSLEFQITVLGSPAAAKVRDTKLYSSLGLGYQFNSHWGVEGCFTTSTWEGLVNFRELTLNQLTASVSYRF